MSHDVLLRTNHITSGPKFCLIFHSSWYCPWRIEGGGWGGGVGEGRFLMGKNLLSMTKFIFQWFPSSLSCGFFEREKSNLKFRAWFDTPTEFPKVSFLGTTTVNCSKMNQRFYDSMAVISHFQDKKKWSKFQPRIKLVFLKIHEEQNFRVSFFSRRSTFVSGENLVLD